ncbi:hypothetical protein PPYR_08360 [Photinus pyralis]|uniref:MalT-like TPR region domain-containing protein n=2 Tax=Photinus pyralis TaxID=7054 RepID=A0A5N4AJ98_PHOPY|nr:tetratricopeptide repeat protein 19 homolog, mitochondrial [Photinus pyralis]KAB0797366.1 hypothetical protein PPYR_08360 [Photinus pyralis]
MFKLCNYCKLYKNYRIPWIPLRSSSMNYNTQTLRRIANICNKKPLKAVIALNVLTWLGFVDTDKDEESELIMTIKRAILATRREQYDIAEQLLHVALRLAQQQQNENGITYCYDLMANLAFDQYDLSKAEKLFISVLQRLLSTGMEQNDLKVIHISLKLARICHLKAENEKADIGYNWCLEKIVEKQNGGADAQMLHGVIHDWYAQFLMDTGDMPNSIKHLKEAYRICVQETGHENEQSMLLLNDIGISNWRTDNLADAEECLSKAASIGNNLGDKSHVGVINANLGLVYLQRGLVEQAAKYCNIGLELGNRHENAESISQANYCLEQIKLNIGK